MDKYEGLSLVLLNEANADKKFHEKREIIEKLLRDNFPDLEHVGIIIDGMESDLRRNEYMLKEIHAFYSLYQNPVYHRLYGHLNDLRATLFNPPTRE